MNALKPKRKNPKARQGKTRGTEAAPRGFSFAIAKVAVAQICKSVGFRRTRISALDTLTLVANKYLEAVAKSAASFSNAANRTQSNLFDLANGLHDLTVHDGFAGASSLHSDNCLLNSTVLKELSDFVSSTDEIPFAKPVEREKREGNEREGKSPPLELRRGKHIPEWLPGVPDVSSGHGECKQRVNGEKLWENSRWVLGSEDDDDKMLVEKRNGGNGGELAEERGRVSFRIGSNGGGGKTQNGVCLNRTSTLLEF